MRILFEYTDAFKRPERNVGIPRVVRNIAYNLHETESVRCIPIISGKTQTYDAQSIATPAEHAHQIHKSYLLLQKVELKLSRWQSHLRSAKVATCWVPILKVLLAACKISSRLVSLLLKICWAKRKKSTFDRLPVIAIQPGDIVIWPDTLTATPGKDLLAQYKSQGARIVIIIYDLFQIVPREHRSPAKLELQVPPMMLIADGFMAISATVLQESREYIQEKVLPITHTNPWTDQFYLGSELDLLTNEEGIRAFMRPAFEAHKLPYLMVGTILPHKNHAYVLDAFDRLWADDIDVTLCIVGKSNEKYQEVIKRIKSHSEWNKRLFMFNDANDSELEYCYLNSEALIFPSFYEGFGLPLVEAMQHGLPVMASDIPIFRELGGDFVANFDLSNPESLCNLIRKYEKNFVFPAPKSVEHWKWITWMESTRQLIDCIIGHEKDICDKLRQL